MRYTRRLLLILTVLATVNLSASTAEEPLHRKIRLELREFTMWLAANEAQGYIGEFDWPDDVTGESARWNNLANAWLSDADLAGLWATCWATGEWWGPDYPLAVYQRQRGDPGVGSLNTQAAILEAHPGTQGTLRGINVAGGAFSAPANEPISGFSNTTPGRYDYKYHYDGQGTFDFLASRGIRIVRIEFRWERLQPLPGGPLDADELQRLRAVVGRAGAAGLGTILDLHNYGAYYLSDGNRGIRRAIGSEQITQEHFVDLWHRLSTEFRDNPNVVAYGLMNEPIDMDTEHFPTHILYDWDTAKGGWVFDNNGSGIIGQDNSTRRRGAGSLRVTRTLNSEGGRIRIHDNQGGTGAVRDLSEGGDSVAVWIYLPLETTGRNWRGGLFAYNGDWAVIDGGSRALIPGQWTQVTTVFPTGSLRAVRALGIQIDGEEIAGAISVYVDDLTQGTAIEASRVWEQASQAALDAVRANGDTKLIMIPGYNWSKVQGWSITHPTAWITDPVLNFRYEAHHYWDREQTSVYRRGYAEEAGAP